MARSAYLFSVALAPSAELAGPRGLYTRVMAAGLRILIIWLIALAIPVQGMAAATMRFCAPTNQARHICPMGKRRAALLVGASGLVGSHLLKRP